MLSKTDHMNFLWQNVAAFPLPNTCVHRLSILSRVSISLGIRLQLVTTMVNSYLSEISTRRLSLQDEYLYQ